MAVAIRNIDWRKVNRVAIAFVLIISFLCLVCWTAPQAHAITMTVTVSIVLLCIAMLAAFGMTVTAPDNTSAINYLMPKILTFAQSKGYNTIEDWVAGETGRRPTLVTLFSVIGSALVVESPIWNCLLEYTKSFVEDEGITSGGDPVGDLGTGVSFTFLHNSNFYGNFSGVGVSSNNISLTYDNAYGPIVSYVEGLANLVIAFDNPAGSYTITVLSKNNTGSYDYGVIPFFSSSSTGLYSPGTANLLKNVGDSVTITKQSGQEYLRFASRVSTQSSYKSSGDIVVSISGNNDFYAPGGTVFTPGDTITEPDPLDLGENGLVYVPGIVDSMSNEDALNHVADKTTTPGGLTAEPDKDGYPIPAGSEWLFDKLTDIDNGISNQNPHTDWIPNSPFNFSFSGIWHYVEDWLDSFTSGIAAVLAVWNEIPLLSGALYGALVAAVVVGVWRRFFE